MTREEISRSFVNLSGRCKMNCPYSLQCNHGDYCVMKEAALIMNSDASKIAELTEQNRILKSLNMLQLNYTKFMEERCYAYYDMIHDYNGGVVKKLYIAPKRKMAIQRRKNAARKARKREEEMEKLELEEMDGDPRYAMRNSAKSDYPAEEIIV